MSEGVYSIVEGLVTALQHLILPAVLFFLLSYLVKGKQALTAFSQCLPNSLFNISIMSFNIVLISTVSSSFIWLYSLDTIDILEELWKQLPEWVVIIFAVFFGDFIGYWRHRFEHSKLLWPSHAMHHSDDQMTWLTLERFHPFNRISTLVIDTALLTYLGFPPYAMIANGLIRHYYGYFIHADLSWDYGIWSYIFVSPIMHRWHHAAEKEAHDTNYATVFSIFDRAFGTYRVPGQCDVPLGVSYSVGGSVLGQLLYPLKMTSYIKKPNKCFAKQMSNQKNE